MHHRATGSDFSVAGRQFKRLHVDFVLCHWVVVLFVSLVVEKNSEIKKIHLNKSKHIYTTNIYIPPRDTTREDHPTEDQDITNTFTHLTQLKNNIGTGDINAHSQIWYSPYNNHRGDLIADIIQSSNYITLNTNTPTRLPVGSHQQPTSPDITAIDSSLYGQTHHLEY